MNGALSVHALARADLVFDGRLHPIQILSWPSSGIRERFVRVGHEAVFVNSAYPETSLARSKKPILTVRRHTALVGKVPQAGFAESVLNQKSRDWVIASNLDP